MCQIWDLEEVLLFISNTRTANSQNSLLTFPAVMFPFVILGSGRINNATDLSRLLGSRKERMRGMEADQLQKE